MPTTIHPPRLRLLPATAPERFLHPSGQARPHLRVGVLATYVDRWFFASVLAGVQRVLGEAGHSVVVHQVGDDWASHELLHGSPRRHGLDAVVAIALPMPADVVRSWEAEGVPVVVAGGRVDGADCVHVDDVRAGRLATEHLLRLGHRRIALVRSHDEHGELWPAERDRSEGHRRALNAHGLAHDEQLVVTVPFGPRGGAQAVERLLALPEPPTAVFTTCDELAFGVVPALTARGLDVPRDVSVVGVDDHPLSETLGLSTVSQQVERQGELAGRLVLDALIGLRELGRPEHHEVGVGMLARTSSAPVPARGRTAGLH